MSQPNPKEELSETMRQEIRNARLDALEDVKGWIIGKGLTRYSNDALDIVDYINKRILDLRTE